MFLPESHNAESRGSRGAKHHIIRCISKPGYISVILEPYSKRFMAITVRNRPAEVILSNFITFSRQFFVSHSRIGNICLCYRRRSYFTICLFRYWISIIEPFIWIIYLLSIQKNDENTRLKNCQCSQKRTLVVLRVELFLNTLYVLE